MDERNHSSDICPKCKGTGRIKGDDGSISTCFDCLQNGKFDVHSKVVKDSNIKL
jgi:DnaJ-class molecular chaperone